jgi:hypothetical protein
MDINHNQYVPPKKSGIIENILNKLKCGHNFILLQETEWSNEFGSTWTVWTYRCTKCCKVKKINNK